MNRSVGWNAVKEKVKESKGFFRLFGQLTPVATEMPPSQNEWQVLEEREGKSLPDDNRDEGGRLEKRKNVQGD